jgi:glycosyltransferase involved in cell wall biosynthesis
MLIREGNSALTSKKRIALVTDKFLTGGGLEHIYQIVRGMSDLHFGVFAGGGQNFEKLIDLENVKIFSDGYNLKQIRRFYPSIIHFHHTKPISRYLLNPLKLSRTPVIYTVHGIHIHKYEYMDGFYNRFEHRLRRYLENYIYHQCDAVIAVSESDRIFIKDNYQREDCHLIPNGLDFDIIPSNPLSKIELRKKLNLAPQNLLFLTVARFNFEKGYDILIDAIAQCLPQIQNKPIQFLFAGEGKEQKKIRRLSARMNIADKIRFLGNRNDVYDLMKACDFLILPSRWEGHSITLIEAAFSKLLVIASDTEGNRELISDGETGILFKNSNAASLSLKILEVIAEKSCQEKITKQAYQQAMSRYDSSRMIDRLRKIYYSYSESG